MNDRVAQTRATYDRIAPEFAARTRDRAALRPRVERFASALRPGALVYDVGCGPGYDSAALRARGLRVVGLDLSAAMLRAGDAGGPLVQADMRRLPLRTGSASGVWANASLLHVPRAATVPALRELARVLAPGGCLHVAVKEGSGEVLDRERYGPDAPRWFTYWGAESFDRALGEAGFAIEAASTEPGRDVWLVRLARRVAPMR